jgi:G3E family GTPase
LTEIKNFVHEINPFANIIQTEYSIITLDLFFENVNSSNLNLKEIENELTKNSLYNEHSHFHEKEKIENIVLQINLKTKEELDNKIGNLLWNLSEFYNFTFIRFKGLFYSDDGFLYSIQ